MSEVESVPKTALLFLCHRIPYPPNKGDKIRSFHLLHHLSQYFDIYLATFVDDPDDWPWVPEVEKFCSDSLFVEQNKWVAKLNSLVGLLTGEALSVPFYASKKMDDWVQTTVAQHSIDHVMVYSSSMAQYVLDKPVQYRRKVVDFVDVDSDKWQQYAEQQRWPMSWLYRREAKRLLAYESRLTQAFDAGLFVSSSEAALFKTLVPTMEDKVGYYNNGVNTEYFFPSPEHGNPFPVGGAAIVFTGAMDYWPNVDAVQWFVRQVLPGLREHIADIRFYIVGSNPSRAVQKLAVEPGVVVTGRVDDVRPYLQYAAAAVAPMRVARGVQNKVLEAMAMAKTVLVSSKGLEGIDACHAEHVLLADEPEDYVSQLLAVFAGEYGQVGASAMDFVRVNFDWANNLPEVVLLLGGEIDVTSDTQERAHG